MNQLPTVSVILPVYNGERFLAQAIESVWHQTLPPLELIIVDDGSTDGSARLVAEMAAQAPFPMHYHYQPNQGPAAARNRAIRVAQGEFLAFQDADDLWTPEKQAWQCALVVANPGVDIVAGLTVEIAEAEDYARHRLPAPMCDARHTHQLQPRLIRSALFQQLGLLDDALRYGEDTDWIFRAAKAKTCTIRHDQVVIHYRRHKDNMTLQMGKRQPYLMRALRRAIARDQGTPGPPP
jgi:glycosyltransferase involved in cell wall biosynthesis